MKSLGVRAVVVACWTVLAASASARAAEPAAGPPPQLRRVKPNTLPLSGGTITLIGSNFDTTGAGPVRVLVGGVECDDVTVRSTMRITATVKPSRGAGPVDVEVVNGDGQKAVLRQALCYDDGKIGTARWFRLKARLRSMWELLEQGGTIMVLLLALSVFGVAWVIHCALVIRPSQVLPRELLDKLSGHLSRGEIDAAMQACQEDGNAFSRVALAALRKAGESPQKIREVAQAAGSREASHLFQKISYLSNIGVISPMLGLLGTVVGMILAFQTIEIGDVGARHMQLGGAINKALVTTAAGLVVGILAMACYYFFRGKLLRIVTEMEQVTEEMAEAAAAVGDKG